MRHRRRYIRRPRRSTAACASDDWSSQRAVRRFCIGTAHQDCRRACDGMKSGCCWCERGKRLHPASRHRHGASICQSNRRSSGSRPRRIVGAMASVRPAATILHAGWQHSGRRAIVATFGPGHVVVAPKAWCSAAEFRSRCHERAKHSSWCKLMRRTRSSCDFDSPSFYPLMPIRKNALSQAPCA